MRGATIIELLNQFRAEARLSANVAHNVHDRDAQVNLLQRVQSWLWDEVAWPHLRVQRQVPLQEGQRYYDPPPELDIDRIDIVEVRIDSRWYKLGQGIEAEHFAAHDSDLDARAWPPRRWQLHEGEQIEVWPIPDQNGDVATLEGMLRYTGIRRLSPLVKDDDTADLDDRLLILFAAAERLAATGGKDAQIKLDLANKRLLRLRGNLTKRDTFNMFGANRSLFVRRRPAVVSYRPPVVP